MFFGWYDDDDNDNDEASTFTYEFFWIDVHYIFLVLPKAFHWIAVKL